MKGKRWKLSDSKIGCISVNPIDQYYFATAQLNREVRLWDARMVLSLKDVNDYSSAIEKASIAVFDTHRACSSAYFDPSGRHLLTTSYDDAIRGWSSAARFSDLAKHTKRQSGISTQQT